MLSPGAPHSLNLHTFNNREALWTQSFWAFMEASLHRCEWLNHRPLVIDPTSNSSFLQECRGWDWKFQCSILGWFPWQPAPILKWFLKVTSGTVNLVVESSSLWITIHPCHLYGSKAISGTEDNRPNMTKDAPIAPIAQEIPRVLRAVSQVLWGRPNIYKKYILVTWMTKYIFLINHNSTDWNGAGPYGTPRYRSMSLFLVCKKKASFSFHELPWVPKGRFKQLLIREGRECRNKEGAVKKQ